MNKSLIEKIQSLIASQSLDCIIFYTSAVETKSAVAILGKPVMSTSYIMITPNDIVLSVIRYLDSEDYFSECNKLIVYEENILAETVQKYLEEKKFSSVGYYADVPFSGIYSLDRKFTNCTSSVDDLLSIKSDIDIEKIRKSAQIASGCLNSISYADFIEKTDGELSHYISLYAVNSSCQLSFPTSVVVGDTLRETTVALPTNKKIANSNAFAIDMGFIHNGFYSDCTRMYFAESDKGKEIYETLVSVHRSIISEIVSGDLLGKIVDLYKKSFDTAFTEYEFLSEDLGHSIGYGLHEYPIFVQGDNAEFVLRENMIITLEPEIIVDGMHYRIEDMVLVTENGCELLTL